MKKKCIKEDCANQLLMNKGDGCFCRNNTVYGIAGLFSSDIPDHFEEMITTPDINNADCQCPYPHCEIEGHQVA